MGWVINFSLFGNHTCSGDYYIPVPIAEMRKQTRQSYIVGFNKCPLYLSRRSQETRRADLQIYQISCRKLFYIQLLMLGGHTTRYESPGTMIRNLAKKQKALKKRRATLTPPLRTLRKKFFLDPAVFLFLRKKNVLGAKKQPRPQKF